MTVVIAEHEVEVIAEYADQVVVLDHGQIVAKGTPTEVFNKVDLLAEGGLRVPQVTELVHKATTHGGRWTSAYPVTLADAVAAIKQRMEGVQ